MVVEQVSIDAAGSEVDRPPAGAGNAKTTLIAPVAAAALVALASFANFLAYHDYPLARREVLVVALALGLIAALLGLAHHWSSRVGKALIDALLWALLIDFNADEPLFAALVAVAVATARVARNISLLTPLSIIAAVVLVSGVTGLSQRRPAIATIATPGPAPIPDKAILHLILDEHGGVGGTEDALLKQQLTQFYTARGFRLFERAYSRHFHTVHAIPDALNFGQTGTARTVDEKLDIGRTAYLSRLEKAGYRLNIYQSDFADFCRDARTASCTTYWSPSLAMIEPMPFGAAEKARLIGYKFAALSDLLGGLAANYDRALTTAPMRRLGLPPIALKQHALSSSIGGFAGLDRMVRDLPSAQPGNVYFGHLLVPHSPYSRTGNCTVMPPSQWGQRRSPELVDARDVAYRQQVTCLMDRLDRLITAFLESPGGRNGVVILHGDHGSRLTQLDPLEWNEGQLSNQDLMASYSTLFAVRMSGMPSGVDRVPYALPHLLERVSGNQFESLDGLRRGTGRVFLERSGGAVGRPTSIAGAWPAAN